MKRNLFLSLNLIVLLMASLAAQGRTPKRDGFSGGLPDRGRLGAEGDHLFALRDGCCRVIPPGKVLDRVLQLDEDQMEDVAVLAEEIAGAVGPLREQLRGNMMAQKDESQRGIGQSGRLYGRRASPRGQAPAGGNLCDRTVLRRRFCGDSVSRPAREVADHDRFCHRRPPRHHGPDHPDGDGEN